MKVGLSIRSAEVPGVPLADRAAHLVRLAQEAERLEFDSVWVPDRTVFPTDIATRYPARFGSGPPIPDSQQVLEPITTMSFLAGVTSRIGLGFSVVVLPFRHPVLNAKMVTTLDVLSGGRVIFGAGVGWMPEEFEGMAAPFADRGAVTDEHIDMFKALCTGYPASYSGRHFTIDDKVFYPKPIQQPHPPVWIGGVSRAAVRRAARVGDGWLPNGMSPADVERARSRLHAACGRVGRSPGDVVMAASASLPTEAAGETRDALRAYRDAGAEYLVASMSGTETNKAMSAMTVLAEARAAAL
jgi:probable F420-dependent oxidoreductase